jgi:hypothetical protein
LNQSFHERRTLSATRGASKAKTERGFASSYSPNHHNSRANERRGREIGFFLWATPANVYQCTLIATPWRYGIAEGKPRRNRNAGAPRRSPARGKNCFQQLVGCKVPAKDISINRKEISMMTLSIVRVPEMPGVEKGGAGPTSEPAGNPASRALFDAEALELLPRLGCAPGAGLGRRSRVRWIHRC